MSDASGIPGHREDDGQWWLTSRCEPWSFLLQIVEEADPDTVDPDAALDALETVAFQPRDEVAQELAGLGALVEWSSTNLLAVDAADESHHDRDGTCDHLATLVSGGQLRQ